MGALKVATEILDGDDRVKLLETKLGVSEKSNRTLLEEVIRMQNDLRLMIRRNEENIKDEQLSRQQIESSLHIVNDLITKLSIRIKSAEDKIIEERSALTSLISHTKGVEQAVIAGQQTITAKKNSETTKIQELNLQLTEIQRQRDQLEKVTFNLTEELRALKLKVDSQSVEFTSTINELKLRSRRLEDENKIQMEALRKHGDLYSTSETSTTHLRGQVESRLSELRDVIMELRTKQEQEVNDRRMLEQQLQQRISELQSYLSEQNRKREEALHSMDMMQREKERLSENEKYKIQGKLSETVEEVNKKLLNKEIKLREELQEKYQQLERLIHQEQHLRQKYEDEDDRRWQGIRKFREDEIAAFKETLQSERLKNKEAFQKLDESISLIGKQLSEQKKQTDKVVAAEIHSRKLHERSTTEKLEQLNEKLSLAASSLQTAIGGVNGNFAFHTDKLRAELKSLLAASEQSNARAVTELDARVQSVKQRISALEQQLEVQISEALAIVTCPETLELNEATAILAQNLREKVESISLWQEVTSQTIRELNQSIQGLPNEIYAVENKQRDFKSEIETKMLSETNARMSEIEVLKHEINLLKTKKQPPVVTADDIQEIQLSIRKLAESVQTVKTVIGMKLQSEQKTYLLGHETLQLQINKLENKLRNVQQGDDEYSKFNKEKLEYNWRHDVTEDIPLKWKLKQNKEENVSKQRQSGRQENETEEADWNLLSSIAFSLDEDKINDTSRIQKSYDFPNKSKIQENKTKEDDVNKEEYVNQEKRNADYTRELTLKTEDNPRPMSQQLSEQDQNNNSKLSPL
ncbi:putative leucine-rich repeat-containing protein DDB_G0290503 isoform X5 [Biomphalaria glabrata]|nr:putative leucine-rich repeat-containing protein DDB_G0290503 isoform X5 [Biomphalaria glabrata]XP_055878048.1 putative leucine-rich repeat-containing protein DDB_G0290503 isoform X5 [Biomphalaria glabrata]XP_055878049.1 putative leucine-rich repeat-containing protein DDB_G0290503 isoform X5 [Biomphalaria glabrata]